MKFILSGLKILILNAVGLQIRPNVVKMKIVLLSLVVMLATATMANAQMIERNPAPLAPRVVKTPVLKTPGENQLYFGPYANDELAENGLGMPGYPDEATRIAVLLPLNLVQKFNGGQVKAIRLGLCAPITHGAVFIYPVTNTATMALGDAIIEQTITGTTSAGWNTIELTGAATLNTEGIEGLLLGFQYAQKNTQVGGYYTDDCYPISVVDEGTICTAYANCAATNNNWADNGLSQYGNVSIQAVVENAEFPDYDLMMTGLQTEGSASAENGIDYVVNLSNIGLRTLLNYTIDVLVDNVVKAMIDSPMALSITASAYSGNCPLKGVRPGAHTLTLKAKTIQGNELANGATVSTTFTTDFALSGDVTGDGQVDIADINAVINMMLGKAELTAAGDVTGDGNVDIADINTVINMMLGK